jgi:hypothetical protein
MIDHYPDLNSGFRLDDHRPGDSTGRAIDGPGPHLDWQAPDDAEPGLALFVLGRPTECEYRTDPGTRAVFLDLDGEQDVRAIRDGLSRWLAANGSDPVRRVLDHAIVAIQKEARP